MVCTIVRPEMPYKCTTITCTMYTMECQIDGIESQDFSKLPQFQKFEKKNIGLGSKLGPSNSQN